MSSVRTEKLWTPFTQESVASTRSSYPPTFLFGAEMANTNLIIHSDNEQHPSTGLSFAVATASRHAHAKHVTLTPATVPPRWSSSTASHATVDKKRQETAPHARFTVAPAWFCRSAPSALPVHQGMAALPKLWLKLWAMCQYGCRPKCSHLWCQSQQSLKLHCGKILPELEKSLANFQS